MAKKDKQKVTVKKKKSGEQLPLIEVGPKFSKEIENAAKAYKQHMKDRLASLAKEVELKKLIIELVGKSELQRLQNGNIEFACGDLEIIIEPTDDKVKVREKKQ